MLFGEKLRLSLLKIFDIQEDELRKTLLLQLNIFLIITTLLIVKPTISSLFLTELTAEALPQAYILTAISAIIGYYFYDKWLEVCTLNKIITRTLIGCILSLIIFGFAFTFKVAHGNFMFIPYIWVAIYGLLTASQFWILANLVYNVREAKKVFGFIGAGAIAGGIFGGYLTSVLTYFISSENILFVAAIVLSGCIPITRYMWNNEVDKTHHVPMSKRVEHKGASPLKLIWNSKLLTYISCVVGISVIVAKLVDFQYNDFALKTFDDPEKLTSFFGFWFSTLSVISLLIQLFFTKKIVGTFGVANSLLWLPTGILIGSILLLLFPVLAVIIFIKIVDGSLKQSVNKAAMELLVIPIPIDIKKKTKTYIDVVIDSIATGIAGFVLIFLIHGLDLTTTHVSFITIILITLWIFFILKVKKAYIVAFKNLLTTPNSKAKKHHHYEEMPISSIVDTIKRVFKTGSEGQILHMLNRTKEVNDERFFYDIEKLLEHESSSVRALAIENLYSLRTKDLSSKIKGFVFDEDPEVQIDAFRYLLRNFKEKTAYFIKDQLESDNNDIVNAVMIALSIELNNKKKLISICGLYEHLDNDISTLETLKGEDEKNKIITILEVIGNLKIERYYSLIHKYLKSKDQDILIAAINNAAKTKKTIFLDDIIEQLSEKNIRKTALDAINSYGKNIISELENKIINEAIEDHEDAIFIPMAIEHFNSQSAINSLITIVEKGEYSITIEAIESLRRLKNDNPKLKIKDRFIVEKILQECYIYESMLSSLHSQIIIKYKDVNENHKEEKEARNGLIRILEQRLDRQLHRIFGFLGIKYPPSDIDSVLQIILNGPEEQRANAIEFLDSMLDIQLKKELIPIAESALVDNEISNELIKKLNLKIYSEVECYKLLLERNDTKLKHAVIYLIEKTNNKNFIPLLEMALKDKNISIRNQAFQVIEYLSSQETVLNR